MLLGNFECCISVLSIAADLPYEELIKKYQGAYDPDFEENLPEDATNKTEDVDSGDETDEPSEKPSGSSSNGLYAFFVQLSLVGVLQSSGFAPLHKSDAYRLQK